MKIVNVEILGRPVNVVIVVLMIAMFWFAFYAINQRGTFGKSAPIPTPQGNNQGTNLA